MSDHPDAHSLDSLTSNSQPCSEDINGKEGTTNPIFQNPNSAHLENISLSSLKRFQKQAPFKKARFQGKVTPLEF